MNWLQNGARLCAEHQPQQPYAVDALGLIG
jgi:hypothetical protein